MGSVARLLLAWLLCCAATGAFAHDPREVARGGVLDLSAPGATATIHELRGDWGFAWQRFVDPDDESAPTATIAVPAPWTDVTADGKPPGPHGFGSYTLTVRCPDGEQLALAVPAQRTAMRMFVNGRLAMAQGVPGPSPDESQAAIGQRAVLTEPFACPLRVVVHLSSYEHRAGGMVRPPISGPLEVLAPDFKQRLAVDTILLGAYLVLSITPAFFFLARRKEATPVLFGLFCLAQTVYSDMTGERLLLQLAVGPQAPWALYLGLEYTAWYLSMGLFLLLVDALFPRALHALALRVLVGACAIGLAITLATPPRIYSHTVFFGQLLGVVIGVYVMACIARAARAGRRDAGVLLAGMGFLFAVLVVNLLEFYVGVALRSLTALGLLAFVLSPALVLLRRLARALTTEEQRSTEQREKADLLVRTTQAGILDVDPVRKRVRYSARLLEILGCPPDTDTSGWPEFFERIHPHEQARVREAFARQLQDRPAGAGEQRHQPEEYRLLRRDGSAVWVHAEAISLHGPDGRALRSICSILDITDHRAVAEGLKRQNAALAENARLREDVERMSRHDLKTPLNSIIGVTRLLREDAAVPPEHRELLAITERAGYRMLEMVNLSLDLSRMEQGTYDFKPQAVNVVDVVSRVLLDVQGMAEAARVQIGLDQAFSKPVYARAEELLCYSILANLVKNAVEATQAHGTVVLGIERGDPVRVWVHNPGQVPPEVVARFFDKYATAGKAGGTGLGTYSARMMARVQEGELDMRTGGEGTVVTLTLRALGAEQLPPAQLPQAHAPGAAAQPAVAAADFPPRRVLVADDDEYNRLLLLRYLPSPPFTVETAANGLAATEAVVRHWPDIILIDMEMPVMNGLEAVAWIRERERREQRAPVPIVMFSSNDDPVSMRRGLAAGSDRYLTKPFTREALLALMRALDRHDALPAQLELEPAAAVTPAGGVPGDDETVVVDAELFPEVPAFLASRQRMVQAMADALAAGDREQLRAVAHRAAGGLALFGFAWAAWHTRQLAASAASAPPDLLAEQIERLRAHLHAVRVRQP